MVVNPAMQIVTKHIETNRKNLNYWITIHTNTSILAKELDMLFDFKFEITFEK